MVVAVIDVGSNTIKVLVVSQGLDGSLEPLHEEVLEARLGGFRNDQGEPYLPAEAIERALGAVEDLVGAVQPFRPQALQVIGTSALRDASNGEAFLDAVERACGMRPVVLTGEEEAQLTGIAAALDSDVAKMREFLLFDLGGGSLEILHFSGQRILSKASLPLGAVRLASELLEDAEAPFPREVREAVHARVAEELAPLKLPSGLPLLGIGGTVRLSYQMLFERGLVEEGKYPPLLPREDLAMLCTRIGGLNLPERLVRTILTPGRADIFPTALAVLEGLCIALDTPGVLQSVRTLRWGVAVELLAQLHEES